MRKPDTNPDNVKESDILCDFCHREWIDSIPMIEGHHGSCICGKCLDVAWSAVVSSNLDDSIEDWKCTMCLEHRTDPCYRSPAYEEAFICRRCIRLTAQVLRKDDPESWDAPGPGREGP